MKLNRVLVPIDFSEHSLEALDYAVEIAVRFKGALTVLAVVEPASYAVPVDIYAAAPRFTDLLAEQVRVARAEMARLEKRLKKRRIRVKTEVRTGIVPESIVQAAKRLKADLIVMGTHGRTGLSHLLVGSVAERVVRTATCPVLTTRGKRPAKKKPRKRATKRTKKTVR